MKNDKQRMKNTSDMVSKTVGALAGQTTTSESEGLGTYESINDHLQIILTTSELLALSIQLRSKDTELSSQFENLIESVKSFSKFLAQANVLEDLKNSGLRRPMLRICESTR
jgi:hypothetical protein